MKLNDYKKLEKTISNQSFNKSYSNINKVMLVLSIFGHIASIFLAYFFLYKLLSSVISSLLFASICSLILLCGLELLKREIFDKFSLQFIRIKKINNKDVIPLFIFSLIIVSLSFTGSLKGAKEFSSKSDQIENQTNLIIKSYEDSTTNKYTERIELAQSDIQSDKLKIDEKDKEQTLIESSDKITNQQKNRVRDLKIEKSELKSDVSKLENDINSIKQELSNDLNNKKSLELSQADKLKKENKNSSFLFVLISTLIEFLILAGVYFNEYYKYRSYNDHKDKIERDPNYQKWILYDSILDTLYTGEIKINDKLPTIKLIIEMCKINGINVLPKDINESMKLFISLNIVKSSGNSKYFSKTYQIAKEILKEKFKLS